MSESDLHDLWINRMDYLIWEERWVIEGESSKSEYPFILIQTIFVRSPASRESVFKHFQHHTTVTIRLSRPAQESFIFVAK